MSIGEVSNIFLTWPGTRRFSAAQFAIGFAIGSRNQWHGPPSPREGAFRRLRLELAAGGHDHKVPRNNIGAPARGRARPCDRIFGLGKQRLTGADTSPHKSAPACSSQTANLHSSRSKCSKSPARTWGQSAQCGWMCRLSPPRSGRWNL